MTRNEFETRTLVAVSATEFDAINEVYMNSDLDKDEFCKMWKKMNASRVEAAKEAKKAAAEKEALLDKLYKIAELDWVITGADANKLAPEYISYDDQKWLESLGIEMRYPEGIYGLRLFKPIYSVLYEVKKYIQVAIAA